MKSGQTVYPCFSTDFLIEDADGWRGECWSMIRERSDLRFVFLTKQIDRFIVCTPGLGKRLRKRLRRLYGRKSGQSRLLPFDFHTALSFGIG